MRPITAYNAALNIQQSWEHYEQTGVSDDDAESPGADLPISGNGVSDSN